jgi:hypothetical protein
LGVKSTLSVYPGLPHVWQILFGLIPEARLALEEVASFIFEAWFLSAHPTAERGRTQDRRPNTVATQAFNREDRTT